MRYGYDGYGDMMSGGVSPFSMLVCLVVLVDLILVGVWLWKQVKK
jgi:hypothetical protein